MRVLNFLLTILSVFTTALKRLRANFGLALCALIALTAAVALTVSVPIYAESASLRVLRDELAKQERRDNRSAFALLFRYFVSGQNRTLEWDRVARADSYITGQGVDTLGLPLRSLARHARTEQFRMLLPPAANAANPFLKGVTLGFVSGMDERIRIVDGAAPRAATSLTQPVEVMLMRDLADQMGVNVGDEFSLVSNSGGRVVSIPIRLAGLWAPVNSTDPGWFFPPSAFLDVVLVPEATFTGPVAETMRGEVAQVLWFAQMEGDGLTAAQALPLESRINTVRAQISGLIPGLKLEQSPAGALSTYRRSVAELTAQLFVFSVPVLGLVLYFVTLVATQLVNRQRSEIALLKTRGVRDSQILGIYLVEWLLMGGLALAAGIPLGLQFATWMGRTQSFLQINSALPGLPMTLTLTTVVYGVMVVALALLAALIPAMAATRRTLVDEQQQAARASKRPFWQRFWLDWALLALAAYGVYQLRTSGGLQLGTSRSADLLANPLLIAVPVLLCFSLGLIVIRLLPRVLEVFARLARIPGWVAPLVAIRNLARQPGNYRGPLLLLILTLCLATFSASMAATLDGSLRQSLTYEIGAPTQLLETGESTETAQGGGQGGQPAQPDRKDISEEARFLFIPVKEHLNVPGIRAASRVASYDDATMVLGGASTPAQVIGIDRSDFPKVITQFNRQWASGESLGGLMNMLARNTDGIIISNNALAKGLKIGDRIPITVRLYGDQREISFKIVAATDLWPGFDPNEKPFAVANLDYIFDQMGGQYPYDVWIDRDPATSIADIMTGVRQLGITLVDVRDTATTIQQAQTQPSRQGLFGLLSVGFIAAAGLTLLGFLLSAIINARRRAIELGVLRAMGLSGASVGVALLIEQLTLVLVGIGAGTLIGLVAARLIVPLMNVKVGTFAGGPSFQPLIAWDQVTIIYLVFAIALVITLLALAWILGRMRLFQAVKLGDAN